jgi:hypothetical protein
MMGENSRMDAATWQINEFLFPKIQETVKSDRFISEIEKIICWQFPDRTKPESPHSARAIRVTMTRNHESIKVYHHLADTPFRTEMSK